MELRTPFFSPSYLLQRDIVDWLCRLVGPDHEVVGLVKNDLVVDLDPQGDLAGHVVRDSLHVHHVDWDVDQDVVGGVVRISVG